MEDQKQQVIEKLQAANNILVTVSKDPSVDQLSACIGLTLLLNKMNKHATAVFSGQVPKVIGFLKPEETIEKNTDSLRDFIIALDKAKADKLRYKVEDEIVKIFITPYKASISEKDLIFSQGDFNVDVVVALGVHRQQELDEAITAHGRILHDAVVISVNNTPETDLGSIHWQDLAASGMSELVSSLATTMSTDLLDVQIATALLTGIVSETDHFGNKKTTPQTMTVSASLLAAGANQQRVATELGHVVNDVPAPATEATGPDGGPLKISHDAGDAKKAKGPRPAAATATPASIDELLQQAEDDLAASSVVKLPEPAKPERGYVAEAEPPPLPPSSLPTPEKTLTELEESVQSPHVTPSPEKPSERPPERPPTPPSTPTSDPKETVDSARKAVEDALKGSSSEDSDPLQALNAVPVNLDLGHDDQPAGAVSAPPVADGLPGYIETPASVPPILQPAPQPPRPAVPPTVQPLTGPLPYNPAANEPAPLNMSPADQPFTMPLPPGGLTVPPPQVIPPTSAGLPPQGPPPPPVPPPMPPGFGPSPR